MELLQKQFKAESALYTPLKFEMTNLVAELHCDINLFHATDLFLYPLNTSENLWFSVDFGEYRNRSEAWNGLMPGAYSERNIS